MQATKRGRSPAAAGTARSGHSLPVKAGTDGSLPPIIRTDAHSALLEARPCPPHHRIAADRAGCYDVSILRPEAERSAPNGAAMWFLAAAPCGDAMPMQSARSHEPDPHLFRFRAGDAALGMIVNEAHGLRESMDGGRADKGPSALLQILRHGNGRR
jgi:hypothetical protein